MEKQINLERMEEIKNIQRMLRVLPPDIGPIVLEDLEVIFSQKGKDGI